MDKIEKNNLNFSKLQKLFFTLLGLLVFGFIFYKLFSLWNKIKFDLLLSNINYIVLSILFTSIFFIFIAVGWSILFRKLTSEMNFEDLIRLYSKSQLARYLPGGIWNYVGRLAILSSKGIEKGIVIQSFLLESLLLVLPSLILGLIFCFNILNSLETTISIFLIIIFTLLIFNSNVALSFLGKIFRRTAISAVAIPKRFLIIMLMFYFIAWIVAAMGFVSFAYSVSNLSCKDSFFNLVGLFPLSWMLGFVSPIPGGIGIRETVLILFLNRLNVGEISYYISIATRGILIISEIISLCIIIGVFNFLNLSKGQNKQS